TTMSRHELFGIWPAGETACPTYFAKKRLIQQGGAGGFACRSNGHNQWSASKINKFPKTVNKRPGDRKYHKIPVPSLTVTIRSPLTFRNTSLLPLGQRISRSTARSWPRPK